MSEPDGAMVVRMEIRAYPPWEEPGPGRVQVQAKREMTVSEVLEAGCGFGYAAFFPISRAHTDDLEDRLIYSSVNLFGVNSEGHVVTSSSGTEVSWGDFVRACEVGLIEGDPYELVVYADQGAAGGSGGLGLYELAQWLFENRETVEFAIVAGGGLAGVEEAIRRPLARLPQARRRQLAERWAKDGVTGLALERLVARRKRWDPDELGPYLSLTPKLARGLLGELGYAEKPDGLYERSTDPERRARRAAYRANSAYMEEVCEPNVLDLDMYDEDWD